MIYCVEDDESIRELMVYALGTAGYDVQGFQDGIAFWEAMQMGIPELIILDIMLPDEDGIEILKKLKSRPHFAQIPVIMASAKGTEYDKVNGLDLGADDYLAKPFGMMEMIARVKAVMRRVPQKEPADVIIRIEELELNESRHEVTANGQVVTLTLKEYELLHLLMKNPGKAFTRDMLLSSVWDTDYTGETRTVDVHIGTLRTKLGECSKYIRTVRGVGYRLEAGR